MTEQKNTISEELASRLTPLHTQMLNRIIESNPNHEVRQVFSPDIRDFSVRVFRSSPMAYTYMTKAFKDCIPTAPTVRKWIRDKEDYRDPFKSVIDQVAMGNFEVDDDVELLGAFPREQTVVTEEEEKLLNIVEAHIEGQMEQQLETEEICPNVQIQWNFADPKEEYTFGENNLSILIDVQEGKERYQITQ
jgi:hypothetical protein